MGFINKFQKYRGRIKGYLQSYLQYFKYRVKYNNPGRPARELVIDIDNITLAIDDRALSKQSAEYKRIYKSVNLVINGEFWEHVIPIHKDDIKLRGFYEHFVCGAAWGDTSLFKEYSQRLQDKVKVQGCTSLTELVDLYERHHDPLYEKLKVDGIQSARSNLEITPIYVYIYKDGSFVYTSGGNHRLYMGKVLGLKTIPVMVRGRHIEWQAIREEFYILGRKSFQERYPSFANHPDLLDSR